jgi:hypothetical protein
LIRSRAAIGDSGHAMLWPAIGSFTSVTGRGRIMGHRVSFLKSHHLAGFTCLLLVIGIAGCVTVRLVADYDPQIDQSVTELQRKCEVFLTSLERSAGHTEAQYDANEKFYDEARIDLSAIRVRAAAIPKNDLTLHQLDLLQDSLEKMEQLHKMGLAREQIEPLRSAFNSSFTAILKLELAKKRGT